MPSPFTRLSANGPEAYGSARGAQKRSQPVSAGEDDRAQNRTDLSIGQSPPESETGARSEPISATGKRLWKRRSLRELGNQKAIFTLPQPRRRRAIFGYISNVSMIIAMVTFSNGSTRRMLPGFPRVWQVNSSGPRIGNEVGDASVPKQRILGQYGAGSCKFDRMTRFGAP
jgi:hypothetical protein